MHKPSTPRASLTVGQADANIGHRFAILMAYVGALRPLRGYGAAYQKVRLPQTMTPHFDFINRLKIRTAMLAIGRSTLRNQGAPGMVNHARTYLGNIELGDFANADINCYFRKLDSHTEALANSFPANGRGNWGAARKSLNIFLRDVVYNRHLCKHFKLSHIEKWLEVPLDSHVYQGLRNDVKKDVQIPKWQGLCRLKQEDSAALQKVASQVAKTHGVSRVHLDVRYWRSDAINAAEAHKNAHVD